MPIRTLERAETFLRPRWYLLGAGLSIVGTAFVFASQALVIYSFEFFLDAAVYVMLQVAGWVLIVEWLRLGGYLSVSVE